jgi:hypothetical protein
VLRYPIVPAADRRSDMPRKHRWPQPRVAVAPVGRGRTLSPSRAHAARLAWCPTSRHGKAPQRSRSRQLDFQASLRRRRVEWVLYSQQGGACLLPGGSSSSSCCSWCSAAASAGVGGADRWVRRPLGTILPGPPLSVARFFSAVIGPASPHKGPAKPVWTPGGRVTTEAETTQRCQAPLATQPDRSAAACRWNYSPAPG